MRVIIEFDTDNAARRAAVQLAIGRILRIGSRPFQQGDIEEFGRCRAIILDSADINSTSTYSPNWARDRMKGAQGD